MRTESGLRRELGNADEVVSDQVEHEVGAHGSDATMLGLAHGAVLLAPPEDALDHGPAGLGDAIGDVAGGALVDGEVSDRLCRTSS